MSPLRSLYTILVHLCASWERLTTSIDVIRVIYARFVVTIIDGNDVTSRCSAQFVLPAGAVWLLCNKCDQTTANSKLNTCKHRRKKDHAMQ